MLLVFPSFLALAMHISLPDWTKQQTEEREEEKEFRFKAASFHSLENVESGKMSSEHLRNHFIEFPIPRL